MLLDEVLSKSLNLFNNNITKHKRFTLSETKKFFKHGEKKTPTKTFNKQLEFLGWFQILFNILNFPVCTAQNWGDSNAASKWFEKAILSHCRKYKWYCFSDTIKCFVLVSSHRPLHVPCIWTKYGLLKFKYSTSPSDLPSNYVSWWYDNVNDFAVEFMNHQDMIWREEIKHLIQLIILIKLEIHDLHS